MDGYWKLYCKILGIHACRKCDYLIVGKRHGNLCYECYLDEQSERYFNKSQVKPRAILIMEKYI